MIGKTGITADTTSRRLLGEGALYLNYGEIDERLLGAVTQGEFNPGITLAQGEVAGAIGVLKGMDYIESCLPTLQATLLELTTENLIAALPGGGSTPGTSRAHQIAEYLGLGDGAETHFSLENDHLYAGTLRIYRDLGLGPVLLTEVTDYAIALATGIVTFVVAPPVATKGYSKSALVPSIDMTAHAAAVNGIVSVDGGAPTAIVFNWAGCNSGALVATQIQSAIQALGGDFAAATCVYVGAPPNDYYLISSGTTGILSVFVCTNAGALNAMVWLKLGLSHAGTEVAGTEDAKLTADYQYDPLDGAATHDIIAVDEIDEATSYFTNIAWLGRTADNPTEDLIIVVKNPLATEMAAWALEEKGNIGVQVTFRGSVTGAAPQELPFEIRRPLPA